MKIQVSDNEFIYIKEMTNEEKKLAVEFLEFKIDVIKEQLKYRTNDNEWANNAICAMVHAKRQLKAVKAVL